jgi:hypothetical protein
VAPSDANILYVGTGEGCLRGDISYGDGVYRSNDAGKTWTNIGLKDTRHIPRVLIDPHNPDVAVLRGNRRGFGPRPHPRQDHRRHGHQEATLNWIRKGMIRATIARKPYTMAYYGLRVIADLHRHRPVSVEGSHSPAPVFVDTGATVGR